MTDEPPADAERALDAHDAIEADGDEYAVTTTVFDATVAPSAPVTDQDGDSEGAAATQWQVTVTVPSLEAATSDPVGEAVGDGWFETFERRLEDAPVATRAELQLDELSVERRGLDLVVTMTFSWAQAARAVDIAKTLVEYVEGTYVEGVVPGYTYVAPVSDLLSQADTGGDAERGGTPL